MKKIYSEPEMEIYVFSKQDQIKASAVIVDPTPVKKSGVEDAVADAESLADSFFWY